MSNRVLVALVLAVLAAWQPDARSAAPRFYSDDPLTREPDSQDASGVQPWTVGLAFDLLWNLFGHPGDRAMDVPALNANTIGEVPDGSWFTNRLGRRTLTAEEIARGPNVNGGPAEGTWTLVSAKTDGVTPGFTIRDSAGVLWFLKFDPPGHRGMMSGTEVAVTKLAWALGYHVPENYISRLHRDRLEIRDGATFQPLGRARRVMTTGDVDDLLERVDRDADGSYRVVASRALPGTPLGPFRFYDTRPDDPNDVVPHEHRRELRGLAVFAAWLNHVDAKSGNSLDTLITDDDTGRKQVRHHLIDFGSTLGSGSLEPRHYWEGYEYMVQPGSVGRGIAGLGFALRPWHTARFVETPHVGRLPADHSAWNPDDWRPRVPNPAFVRARADDRFWAARILAAMSDDLITAAVKSSEYGDEESERIVIRALIDRRDAVLRAYLPAANPIMDPALEGRTLTFRNAAVDARVAEAPESYRAHWHRFDNATGEVTSIGETSSSRPEIAVPSDLPSSEGAYLRVDVAAVGGRAEWQRPAHLYFRRMGGEWKLVGLYRLGDEPVESGERLRFGRLGGAADPGMTPASARGASPRISGSGVAAGV